MSISHTDIPGAIFGGIYIAARYSRRSEMRGYAQVLAQHGFIVTSRWLWEEYPENVTISDLSPQENELCAQRDLEDIREAEMFIFFAEDPLVGTPRGGRHVEFGYALAFGMEIYVIGPPENIFHFTGNVQHCSSIEKCISLLYSLNNYATMGHDNALDVVSTGP